MPTLYIAGQWDSALDAEVREIRCPADGTLVAEVDEAGAEDSLRAIAAARQAFDDGLWRATSIRDRSQILLRVADLLQRDRAQIARMESLDTGKRFIESEYDVDDVTSVFRHYGEVGMAEASDAEGAEPAPRVVDVGRADVLSRIVHEPIGVCALITPWNYPLLQVSWKVAPCLLAGNTFVLKPSELTPHSAIHLMRLLEEAGVPAGVANLVLGAGPGAGAPLSTDPRVDLVSFTGGAETGKRLMANAAETVKKVALELGGKNPNIVFADAEFDTAVDMALTAIFLHSGQVCSAGARLIVEDTLHDRLVGEIVRRAADIRLGGPFDDNAQTGPLISQDHLDKVTAYVDAAVAEGANLVLGGRRVTTNAAGDDLSTGFYFPPTVLDDADTSMACTQQESFGPVLTVETFSASAHEDLESAAVRIANDSVYGLAGAVWTTDDDRAERVARRLRMGTVWINDYHPYVAQAEWGGYKQSGTGRELGAAGLDEYREIKHIWRNTASEPQGWFGDGEPVGGAGDTTGKAQS